MGTTTLLVGAWELVSGSYVLEDGTTVTSEAAALVALKILSENRFSFVTHSKGAFYAAGGGDYAIEGDVYEERPVLASHEAMIGQAYTFQFALDGDTWTNARWQDGVCVEREVWRRIR